MNITEYRAKPNKTIREHTDDLLNNLDILRKLGYIKSEKLYDLSRLACEYHDYGKANIEFQQRIKNNTRFNESKEVAHNVLSLYFLDKSLFEDIEDYYKVGFAILNHHSYCNNLQVIQDPQKKVLIESLLNDFKVLPVTRRILHRIDKVKEDTETILIKGFLHKCDYSASGMSDIEYRNNFLNKGLTSLLDKWRLKNQNSNWNSLQEFCKTNTDNNIIAIAQTGMGKTEAGLHWIGNNKGFFILPLRAAINAIYDRVKNEVLDNKDIEKRLALLHSDALSYYNKDSNAELDIMDYYKQSRQLAMPLSISTADQLFDFVFKAPEYELKLATLSYSKIVIDEIQMYSADILAFLIYGIKKINKLGGKVAILTATLAPFIKDLLKDGENSVVFAEGTFVNDIKRHNVKLLGKRIDSNDIYRKYLENKARGISNKILVVCNTVKKAQQIYEELNKKELENFNILHSKFIKCERATKEKIILEFGKTKNEGEGIWITTQIVEASLDIDFDYLFTELSELSGLFQRLGRINRKGFKSVDETNCFIYLEIDRSILTNGDKGFIDKKIYEISKNALVNENAEGVLTEKDKLNLINKYLTTENLKGSDYLIKYREFSKYIDGLEPYQVYKRDIKFRDIISFDVIPENVYLKNKEEIEKSTKLLQDTDTSKLQKVELKENIKKYTVPVGMYDINRKRTRVKTIQLSNYEFIDVVKCEYNELGFKRISNQ